MRRMRSSRGVTEASTRVAQVRPNGGVDRPDRVLVFDKIAEARIFLVADWGSATLCRIEGIR